MQPEFVEFSENDWTWKFCKMGPPNMEHGHWSMQYGFMKYGILKNGGMQYGCMRHGRM